MDARRSRVTVPPYRLGFAVKILGAGGVRTADSRRHQNAPHLSRSLELLDAAFDYLDANDIRVFRLSSNTVPYGTHSELPAFDYRRQIAACAEQLEAVGNKASDYGLRLSTHPGQYTVINAPDPALRAKSLLDLEQDALLLDALGQGPEATVVVHVGGRYDDRSAALDRWARAYESLSDSARRRVALEHDELLSTSPTCWRSTAGPASKSSSTSIITAATAPLRTPASRTRSPPSARRGRRASGRRRTCRARGPSCA